MNLVIKKINDNKKGLFTNKSLEKDQIILKFEGIQIKRDKLQQLSKEQQDNLLQIGLDLFLDLTGEHGYFINHSCLPNCYIKVMVNTAFLLALRDIEKGEELTFDYSTTSTDTSEEWKMFCGCHKFYCRGIISGIFDVSDKIKSEMTKNKMLPNFIQKTLNK